MKKKSAHPVPAVPPTDEAIRDYAFQLFQQGDGAPGHDLQHWFEATAALSANAAVHRNGLHHNPPIRDREPSELSIDS